MGKAYSEEQRARVKGLLEMGRDEEAIEKETGVSDRTIRRWKLELERTGRIGKPPESRTGRHRVLNPEIEAALFERHKQVPDMSVDDMLWWLWETHKIVVGTRTIRRVFERNGNKMKGKGKNARKSGAGEEENDDDDEEDDEHGEEGAGDEHASPMHADASQYQSPYGPIPPQGVATTTEQQLAQALQQHTPQQTAFSAMQLEEELPEDEETIQLQLQQIALQRREVELKLKMRRLQSGKVTPSTSRKSSTVTPQSAPSSLYNPNAALGPTPPKRDSRSKKKIEESRRRTAERQERMLRDLERRSRRRDHLTAEWVQSKDIWPLRAQGLLADLMHQYGCYAPNQSNIDTFEGMYRDLYTLVDHSKGDWVQHIHDEMLRERMRRKMGQLRTKMQKTGEIIGRSDGYGGFQKAEDYTGEQAGAVIGDESELPPEMQAQAGGAPPPHPPPQAAMGEEAMRYEPVPDHQQMQASNMPYAHAAMMASQQPGQYPMLDHNHPAMLPYGQMNGQQGGMVM